MNTSNNNTLQNLSLASGLYRATYPRRKKHATLQDDFVVSLGELATKYGHRSIVSLLNESEDVFKKVLANIKWRC